MYKTLVIQITMVLQTFCEESLPHYSTTSENKDIEVVQKEFLTKLKQAVEEAIDHQQNSNVTEPLDVTQLKELKEMLKTFNGTDLEGLQAQHKEALRHGRLNMNLADMAKIFQINKQKQQKLQLQADSTREKMRKRINQWIKQEALKKEKKAKKKAT